MATRTIETKAIISAEDRTGPAFAAVVQHMARMEDAARKAKTRMAEVTADKYLAGGQGRVERINQEHAATRRVLVENRTARREELSHLREIERLENRRAARQAALGIVGGFAAHETAHFAHRSLETYREFDNNRRYGKAVMGITDEQQEPLVRQAIHGGGTSKYNDIQWLEAQRELAARGLSVDQVMAIAGVSEKLGQAMDRTLPEASRALEGGMFGFGKDNSTYEKALANAQRTADLQVKGSKISGMGYEDMVQLYKYGAAPFRMAGLSEEQLVAFGGIGKKANMGGDEMGVAARALSANLMKPTAGARTAMLANGIDYSKYQTFSAKPMEVEPFARSIAQNYGVELSEHAKAALQKVFSDKALVQDAAKFMPAVMQLVNTELGGKDAKAKKLIAGDARQYRDASVTGVDSQSLFRDVMVAIANNPTLANKIFGSKQGARIRTAMGDPKLFLDRMDQLTNHSQGFAGKVSDERMAGFDGAISRFEGAVKNLESALPRAFDANGKGGMLTNVSDVAGKFVQALAEAPPQLQRLGAEAGLLAGAFAGIKGAEAILGGFGLKATAGLLDHSAGMLEAAAIKLGATGKISDLPSGGSTKSDRGRFMKIASTLPVIATAAAVVEEGLSFAHDWHDEHFGPDVPHGPRQKMKGPPMGGNDHRASLNPSPASLSRTGFAPIGGGGDLPAFAQKPVKLDVSFSKPATVVVEVQPSSSLIAIVNKMQSITLKPTADTGPGGLGETHTGQ